MLPPLLLVVVIASEPVQAQAVTLSADAERALRSQLDEMHESWLKGDDAGTLQRMYPRWVERLGPSTVRRWLELGHATNLEKAHLKVLSETTTSVRGCAEVRGQIQCVVEGERVMESWTASSISEETQTLAFSGDRGKTWSFVPVGFAKESDLQGIRVTLPELSADLPLRPVRPWIMKLD